MLKNNVEKKSLFILMLFVYLFSFQKVVNSDFIESNRVDWDKLFILVSENKLPQLSKEDEEKILKETDRILSETKSIHSACTYMVSKIGEKRGRYLVYSNPGIKEKLVDMFKMRIQCALKKDIQSDWKDYTMKRDDLTEEQKKNVLRWKEQKKQLMKRTLESLVSKDGDRCPECYVFDPELKRLLTPPPGLEREFEPEGVYYDIESFYSVALSAFPTNIYDYLWVSRYNINNLPEYPISIILVKVYPKQFLDDILSGYLEDSCVYRKEGEGFYIEQVFEIIKLMIEKNPLFVTQEKSKIKSALIRYILEQKAYYNSRREKLLLERKEKELKDEHNLWYSFLLYTYGDDIRMREKVLEIYEKIAEKEDIENIKKLAENIPLDYPVREIHKEYDEKSKNEYLQRVKEFQERVNALIEKLSQQ